MRRAAMSLIALLAVPMLGGSAQARSSPEVGQRIRLLTRADSHWLVGKLVAQDGDSLRLLADDSTIVTVGRRAVTLLHVRSGRRSHARRGALIGALIGGTFGAIAGYSQGQDHTGWFILKAEDKAVLVGLAGAAGGALVGGSLGAVTYSDTWVSVPTGPARVSLAPHSLGLAVSVRF